ncbi:uncharacterized protein V1518DRAFT_408867 [Limtongia smithiae]|uniref:uncharacterized protein n=1 Tax=Limtongia smithiae TaxID=1125753 RepID=UPI0034CD7D8F
MSQKRIHLVLMSIICLADVSEVYSRMQIPAACSCKVQPLQRHVAGTSHRGHPQGSPCISAEVQQTLQPGCKNSMADRT